MSDDQIVRIEASGVLNEFDYCITFDDEVGEGRLAVIYAENGRGKTNLLRAISFLLTPTMENIETLIEVPVQHIAIQFASGGVISMVREDAFRGSLRLKVSSIPSVVFQDDESSAEMFGLEEEAELIEREFTVEASDFAGRLYRRALEDRREFLEYMNLAARQSSGALFIGDTRLAVPVGEEVSSESIGRSISRRPRSMVSRLLEQAERTLSRAAFEGLKRDSSGQGVYVDIAKRTLLARSGPSISNTDAYESMVEQISRIERSGALHENYGLISLRQVRGISQLLSTARRNGANNATLHSILNPFLDNIESQIETLYPAVRQIDTFVAGVNKFLERKELVYSTNGGIELRDGAARLLDPDSLSSGERHLLALMCHAVISTASAPLMIIDEPEISLGLDWQRMLLAELLNVTADSQVKILAASHSVQVMGVVPHNKIIQPTEVGGEIDAVSDGR